MNPKHRDQPAPGNRRRRREGVRDQVVSIDSGSPGGMEGLPDAKELRDDQAAHAEKGDQLEDPAT